MKEYRIEDYQLDPNNIPKVGKLPAKKWRRLFVRLPWSLDRTAPLYEAHRYLSPGLVVDLRELAAGRQASGAVQRFSPCRRLAAAIQVARLSRA